MWFIWNDAYIFELKFMLHYIIIVFLIKPDFELSRNMLWEVIYLIQNHCYSLIANSTHVNRVSRKWNHISLYAALYFADMVQYP